VLQERAQPNRFMLRLPAADEALQARLSELQGALAGKALMACK
jgi:hypothetical protein